MQELVPGRLITWTANGLLGIDLRSYAYRRGDVVVWIDPAMPEGADAEAVLAFGEPQHVLLTTGLHDRDVAKIRERFGIPVWVPEKGGDRFIPKPDHRYTWQSDLPAGLKAVSIPGIGGGEHALVGDIDGKRFAFVGDAVFHYPRIEGLGKLVLRQPKGEFQHKVVYWGGGNKKVALKEAKRLISLELGMVLPTHGTPVLEDAHAKIRESLSAW